MGFLTNLCATTFLLSDWGRRSQPLIYPSLLWIVVLTCWHYKTQPPGGLL